MVLHNGGCDYSAVYFFSLTFVANLPGETQTVYNSSTGNSFVELD